MVLHIRGDAGSGKQFLLKHAAQSLEQKILFVDFSVFAAKAPENLCRQLAEIQRVAMLLHCVVCWYHVNLLQEKGWKNPYLHSFV